MYITTPCIMLIWVLLKMAKTVTSMVCSLPVPCFCESLFSSPLWELLVLMWICLFVLFLYLLSSLFFFCKYKFESSRNEFCVRWASTVHAFINSNRCSFRGWSWLPAEAHHRLQSPESKVVSNWWGSGFHVGMAMGRNPTGITNPNPHPPR